MRASGSIISTQVSGVSASHQIRERIGMVERAQPFDQAACCFTSSERSGCSENLSTFVVLQLLIDEIAVIEMNRVAGR